MELENFFVPNDPYSSDSEVETEDTKQKQRPNRKRLYQSDDEGEGKKKKMKSEKDKKFEKFNKIADTILDKLYIQDFNTVSAQFLIFQAELKKSSKVIEKEGVPKIWWKLILQINDDIENMSAADKKKLSKSSSQGVNKLKQVLKKLLKDEEVNLNKYKEQPLLTESEEESQSEEESSEDSGSESSDESSKKSEKDSADDDWDSSEGEAGEDKIVMDWEKNRENMSREQRRLFWLKKDGDKDYAKDLKDKDQKKKERKNNTAKERVYDVASVDKDYSSLDLKRENIVRILAKLCTNRSNLEVSQIEDNINLLTYILSKSKTPTTRIECIIIKINFMNEVAKIQDLYISRNNWLQNFELICELHYLLNSLPTVQDQIATYINVDNIDAKYTEQQLNVSLLETS